MKIKICLFTSVLVLASCASKKNKALDDKLSKEPEISSRKQLQSRAQASIDNAVNLTAEQKEKLSALRLNVSNQMNEYNKQSLELRSILIKDLLSSNYNHEEVGLIKSRLRKLENKRLSAIFESIEKANVILGREAELNRPVMEEFLDKYVGH